MKLTDINSRDEIGKLLAFRDYKIGLEIGCAYGENAESILSGSRLSCLFLVDPWKMWDADQYVDDTAHINMDGAYNYCINKLSKFPGRFAVLRMTSDEAAKIIPDGFLDFCYIDGNHHEPQVSRDIMTWRAKVKVGGLLGGHDYYDCDKPTYKCQVKSAVVAYFGNNVYVTESCKSWWVDV